MILATLRRRAVGALTCVMLAASPAIAVERVNFIAAEEVAWDYAPSGRDLMMDMDFDEDQQVFVASSAAGSTRKRYIAPIPTPAFRRAWNAAPNGNTSACSARSYARKSATP